MTRPGDANAGGTQDNDFGIVGAKLLSKGIRHRSVVFHEGDSAARKDVSVSFFRGTVEKACACAIVIEGERLCGFDEGANARNKIANRLVDAATLAQDKASSIPAVLVHRENPAFELSSNDVEDLAKRCLPKLADGGGALFRKLSSEAGDLARHSIGAGGTFYDRHTGERRGKSCREVAGLE